MMSGQAMAHGHDYRQGYRDALGMIVRGLLSVEADRVDIGELFADLSRYEEEVDAWLADGAADPPVWHPAFEVLGTDEG
jgi:hypothetical protein